MLGTTPTSIELINLAKARGIYTITTDYLEPEQSPAKLISDEYWMISTGDLDTLEQKCKEEEVTAIITGVSENNIRFMIQLCERLNLPCWCNSKSWNAIQNKDQFKKLCRENGVPTAKDYFLSNPPTEKELHELQLPVVVKPVDLNATQGVSFCHTKEEVIKACEYARSLSSKEELIVEKMFTGRQYLAHYAMADGEVSWFGLHVLLSQPGHPERCFSLTTTENSQQALYLKNMVPAVKKMLQSAGCKDGICWMQLFLEDDKFYAIEMGYRCTGGLLEIPLKEITGFDSFEWLLDVQLGVKHTALDLPEQVTGVPEKVSCVYNFWSSHSGTVQRIEGMETVSSIPGISYRMIAKEGAPFSQYQSMVIIVFTAENKEEMFDMVRKLNETVHIYDENNKDALIYYDDFDTICALVDN